MDTSFFITLPKVELHNHLEGSITPTTLHEIAKKNVSESICAQSLAECEKIFNFTTFQDFLLSFAKVNSFIKNSSDLEIIVNNSIEQLKLENYAYIEYFISIDTFMKKGIELTDLLDRLQLLRRKFSSKDFIIGGFNIDFVRNYGAAHAGKILRELSTVIDDYRDVILGISIGGDEANFPAPAFKELFEEARSIGLKTTAHAGEAAGPESVWDTILHLKTDRIGHGLRINDSLDLLKHFRVTQTPLEICPTSNVKTGLIPSLEAHPLHNYLINGLNFSINTDDAGFFKTSLSSELQACVNLFDFELDDLKQTILNAAHGSFYDPFLKKELLEKLKIQLDKVIN